MKKYKLLNDFWSTPIGRVKPREHLTHDYLDRFLQQKYPQLLRPAPVDFLREEYDQYWKDSRNYYEEVFLCVAVFFFPHKLLFLPIVQENLRVLHAIYPQPIQTQSGIEDPKQIRWVLVPFLFLERNNIKTIPSMWILAQIVKKFPHLFKDGEPRTLDKIMKTPFLYEDEMFIMRILFARGFYFVKTLLKCINAAATLEESIDILKAIRREILLNTFQLEDQPLADITYRLFRIHPGLYEKSSDDEKNKFKTILQYHPYEKNIIITTNGFMRCSKCNKYRKHFKKGPGKNNLYTL
jgi:hypothetical protein